MISVSKAGSVVGYGTTTPEELLRGQMELDMEGWLVEAGLLPMFDADLDPDEEGIDYADLDNMIGRLELEAEELFTEYMLDAYLEHGGVGISQTRELAIEAAAVVTMLHLDLTTLDIRARV